MNMVCMLLLLLLNVSRNSGSALYFISLKNIDTRAVNVKQNFFEMRMVGHSGENIWKKKLNYMGTRLRHSYKQLQYFCCGAKKKKAKGRHLNLVTQV